MVAIKQGQDLEEIKIEELHGILEAQEIKLNERNLQRSVEQPMQAQTTKGNNYDGGKNKKGKGKWKNNKWKGSGESSISSGNHNQNEEIDKKNGGNHKVGKKKFNKKGIQCYNYQKWEHFADECRNKKIPRNDNYKLRRRQC